MQNNIKKQVNIISNYPSVNTESGKEKGKLLPKIEEISREKGQANTQKLNQNILMVTVVFLNQKRMNVCEHMTQRRWL